MDGEWGRRMNGAGWGPIPHVTAVTQEKCRTEQVTEPRNHSRKDSAGKVRPCFPGIGSTDAPKWVSPRGQKPRHGRCSTCLASGGLD